MNVTRFQEGLRRHIPSLTCPPTDCSPSLVVVRD